MTESKHISYYIEEYKDSIKQKFYEFLENSPIDDIPYNNLSEMKEIFDSKLKIDTRTSIKYTKIITMNKRFLRPIVHSFILNRDDNKFVKGDILLPDYHYEPFRERHFGNVFKYDYNPTWYKPLPPEDKIIQKAP